MWNTFKLSILSTSTLLLLAACGGDTTTTEEPAGTDDPAVETPTDSTDDTGDETTDNTGEDNADDTTGDDASDGVTEGTDVATDTTNGISNVDFPVSLEDAVQTFLDANGESVNIDEIDFDDDNNVYTYEISGWDDANEYDMEIDAETGDIVGEETESESDNDDQEMIDINNILTPQEAMDIAEQELGADVLIEGWTIEVDDGITVYDFDTEGAGDDDLTLNAETGDVVDR